MEDIDIINHVLLGDYLEEKEIKRAKELMAIYAIALHQRTRGKKQIEK